jgi:hypothetical protein
LKFKRAYAASFCAVIVIVGCALNKSAQPGSDIDQQSSGSDYRTIFDRWTREGRIYDSLDVKLISAATYLSAEFRRAFAVEYARRYQMTDLEKAKLFQDQKNAGTAYEDFIFAAYVPEKAWDDFDKKTSIWKIYITTDGIDQIKPIEIRKLDKRDAKTAYFYSYLTPWKSIYRLRFPKLAVAQHANAAETGSGSLKLMITSVLGSSEMVWQLQP